MSKHPRLHSLFFVHNRLIEHLYSTCIVLLFLFSKKKKAMGRRAKKMPVCGNGIVEAGEDCDCGLNKVKRLRGTKLI